MKLQIDLNLSLKEHVRGPITAIQTYWLAEEPHEPCLVIIPTAGSRRRGAIKPCVVRLSTAWRWDEATGDPEYAIDNARVFARNLGFNENDWRTVFAITSTIQGLIQELVMQMPYARWAEMQTVAIAVETDSEGKVTEKEVQDYVH